MPVGSGNYTILLSKSVIDILYLDYKNSMYFLLMIYNYILELVHINSYNLSILIT